MPHHNAIQTRYRGHHFRSRLEARWAVFFDALGIKWEYEKEGYVLEGDGTFMPAGPYLPDFWLPDFKMWAEIKGELPIQHWVATEPEIKIHQLVWDTNAAAGFVFFGLPSDDVLVYHIALDYSASIHPLEYTDRSIGI